MRVLARFLLAAGAGLFVLMVGVLGAIVLGGFAVLERNAATGDGFLILEFIVIGVLICVPLSIAAASWVLFRPGRNSNQGMSQTQAGLFLGR